MADTEDEEMAEMLIKEEGQTEVRVAKKREKDYSASRYNPVLDKSVTENIESYETGKLESDIKQERENLEHEAEREKSREVSEELEMASQEPEEEKEDHLQKTLEGIKKKIEEETTPEKKAALMKSAEGLEKKIVSGGKKVSASIGSAVQKYQEYKAKEPERIQSAIAVEKSKIQLAQERQKLDMLRAQQQNSTPGFAGTGLGGGALPFSNPNAGVGFNSVKDKVQMIKEKVTTYVRGRPVTTERWVPVKGAAGRKNIPADQQELYAKELQTARVFEEHLPFGGQQSFIGREQAPTQYQPQQQQRQRIVVRQPQRQQPAPFSTNVGVFGNQRQPQMIRRKPTRVVGRQEPQGQIVINVNQNPLGVKQGVMRRRVNVQRRQPVQPNVPINLPFGGWKSNPKQNVNKKQIMPFGNLFSKKGNKK